MIGSSVSQIAISETSHKQPSISNLLSLTSRVVTLYNINFVESIVKFIEIYLIIIFAKFQRPFI